jgi:hypothetical protein
MQLLQQAEDFADWWPGGSQQRRVVCRCSYTRLVQLDKVACSWQVGVRRCCPARARARTGAAAATTWVPNKGCPAVFMPAGSAGCCSACACMVIASINHLAVLCSTVVKVKQVPIECNSANTKPTLWIDDQSSMSMIVENSFTTTCSAPAFQLLTPGTYI